MNYKVNNDRSAVVSTDYSFNDDMSACPRGNKVLLLGEGGTASISEYHGEAFWVGWFPLPRRKVKPQLSQT